MLSCLSLLIFTVTGPFAAESSSKTTPKSNSSATADSTSVKAQPVRKKPVVVRTVETQLSGFTSQDADQLYARLALQEKKEDCDWFVRGSYSRTATKDGSKSHVNTLKFDSRFEHRTTDRKYSVWTGVISRRDRQIGKRQPTRSGYHLISCGSGRLLSPRFKADIGIGLMKDYDTASGTEPTLTAALRGRHPLNPKLDLESEVLVLQPTKSFRSTKVDSDLALVHQFAPGLSLRLGWSVNNLIRPVRGSHEWDSIVRLVIAYRHTTTR